MGIEEFDIEDLIEWGSFFPEFEEKFIETFDSSEAIEVAVKLAINIDAYFKSGYDYDGEYFENYDYWNMVKDLGILYGIYKNEEEFEEDNYDEVILEDKFFEFYEQLEELYPNFYKELKKKGLTDKQIYDDAFQKSGKYGIEWDFEKLAKKHDLYSILEEEDAYDYIDISDFI